MGHEKEILGIRLTGFGPAFVMSSEMLQSLLK
jgi:hypothetical protein